MVAIELVTTGEAQFLTGRTEKDINRAIDRGLVDKIVEVVRVPVEHKPKRKRPARQSGKARKSSQRALPYVAPASVEKKVRKLGASELLFFVIEGEVQKDLTPTGRKKLYETIKTRSDTTDSVSFGPFEANVARTVKALTARYKELLAVRAEVDRPTHGDPVLKGTDISVYRVAALAETQTLPEILADYPSLSEKQVRRAIDYASTYAKAGRPYPVRSFKRGAALLAAAGVFDYAADGS